MDALESEQLLSYSFQETRTELPLTLLNCMQVKSTLVTLRVLLWWLRQ